MTFQRYFLFSSSLVLSLAICAFNSISASQTVVKFADTSQGQISSEAKNQAVDFLDQGYNLAKLQKYEHFINFALTPTRRDHASLSN
jgi:hypothetical protein